MTYTIHKSRGAAQLDLNWQNPEWHAAETLEVKNFRPESSAHRPQTFARLLHDERNLHGIFQVHDRFVRSTRTGYGSEVWKDACVEFFIESKPERGYFNFEFNCGGAFLCNHIVDPTRTTDFFKQATRVPSEVAQAITVRSSMPPRVETGNHRTGDVDAPILDSTGRFGGIRWPAWRSVRPTVARKLLQMRRGQHASALGRVVTRGRIQFPPSALLWRNQAGVSAMCCRASRRQNH